ncbi:universal stress protein [Micromonospora sp. C32]|uniref:universal stress protein n=1 Tax=unclassified Micromonospora TaxID=2617518 RepID=UPI001B363EA5|nr:MULTISPECIES: universal stress protein [unclassified Micromonospora]MBQ1044156.1 universal stress protein [Micromonospora sp. C72]MBQ1058308.1 universal stress protein [Micromonospora sp. C32]
MTDQAEEHDRRIVVGVDGSPGSRIALRWAVAQAELSDARVDVVGAWHDPAEYAFAYGWSPAVFEDVSIAAITEKMLVEAVADVASGGAPVQFTTHVVRGHPAQVLLDAADGAQLLVVGSRGHGAFAGMLLGSVTQHCVQHASCPVVIVPSTDRTVDEVGSD